MDSRGGLRLKKRLLRMRAVNAVPALGHTKIGELQKCFGFAQNQLVDFGPIEDVDARTVLVRVSQCDSAIRGLRDENVNEIFFVLRLFTRNAFLQFRKGRAHLERLVEPQRQPGRERWTRSEERRVGKE